MWIKYNPNPCRRSVGDCSVRAVSKALDIDWHTAYELIAEAGYEMCDVISSDAVWGSVLRQHGFDRAAIPNSCPDCFTAEDFCHDNPSGVFVLAFGGHVATVVDGAIYDSWDSRNEIPVYVFYRKDE